MICADCGEATTTVPCGACGQEPLLAGHYRLEERIGRGGRGTVYRAIDVHDERSVAIKEVALGAGQKLDELALREVAVLQQLDHPAVPAYLDHVMAGRGRGRALFVVQRFVDGRSLADELERHRYSEDEVLAILDELCDVLAYLHGRSPPVIHRDLKPQNVLRGPSGLVLVDFGAVRDVLKTTLGGSTVAGTFGFMAPEQFKGDATPATDIFGLGALAIALLSRKDPAQLHDRQGRFSWEEHVELTGPMTGLLQRMTAPDPADRPQNVDAVRTALAAARGGQLQVLADLPTIELARAIRSAGAERKIASIKALREQEPSLDLKGAKEAVEGLLDADMSDVEELLRQGVPISALPVVRTNQAPSKTAAQRQIQALVVAGLVAGLGVGLALMVLVTRAQPVPDVPVPAAPAVPAEPVTAAPTFGFERSPMARLYGGSTELRIPLDGVDGQLDARELIVETPDGERLELVMPDTLPYRDAVDELSMANVEGAWLDHGTLVVRFPTEAWDHVTVEGPALGGDTVQLTVLSSPGTSPDFLDKPAPSYPAEAMPDQLEDACQVFWLFDGRGNYTGANVGGCMRIFQESVMDTVPDWRLAGAPDNGLSGYLSYPIQFKLKDPTLNITIDPDSVDAEAVMESLKKAQNLHR